mmetsp:Transcript_66485/g.191117  ORF Transcript_66485/g.191117 Transcript_66485/m.191117 type:complete len:81 (+) Transcript_66485:1355-1597(+)
MLPLLMDVMLPSADSTVLHALPIPRPSKNGRREQPSEPRTASAPGRLPKKRRAAGPEECSNEACLGLPAAQHIAGPWGYK